MVEGGSKQDVQEFFSYFDEPVANAAESLARREGLEPPTLRFEVSRRRKR